VILVEANLLLYAYDSLSEHHTAARAWWEQALNETEAVAIAPVTVLAFLRIATNARLAHPLSMRAAVDIVQCWLDRPNVVILEAGPRHWEIMRDLMRDFTTGGSLVMDAHLAALALEHGAVLCTTDRDFSWFPGLRVRNPLVPE